MVNVDININLIKYPKAILTLAILILLSCNSENYSQTNSSSSSSDKEIIVAAERQNEYIDLLKGKRVAVVANHASFIKNAHIVDSLLKLKINVLKVFSPEHGFRGDADAGEIIKSEVDARTKLPIISLYGNNKKPSKEQLKNVDIILFDLQDVGVRFYTYISTLHYVMEAAAENNIPLIVLDRPNPNANYIDGPVLEDQFKSFVGLHPIPVVYGMTIGELALMINGEKWISSKKECSLKVISCSNYHHKKEYILPIAPSPNLPNQSAIYLYPSLCFFEGTTISVGRGTDYPFQQIGSPKFKSFYNYDFTPSPSYGAKNPKHKGKKCYGLEFYSNEQERPISLNLEYLLDFYSKYPDQKEFFNEFFNLLAGNKKLKGQINNFLEIDTLRKSWESDIAKFKQKREKYLIYD